MDTLEKLELEVVMPGAGDMELVDQAGGAIRLKPIFYGAECMGPHVLVREDGKVVGRYKIRMRKDGKLELKKGD